MTFFLLFEAFLFLLSHDYLLAAILASQRALANFLALVFEYYQQLLENFWTNFGSSNALILFICTMFLMQRIKLQNFLHRFMEAYQSKFQLLYLGRPPWISLYLCPYYLFRVKVHNIINLIYNNQPPRKIFKFINIIFIRVTFQANFLDKQIQFFKYIRNLIKKMKTVIEKIILNYFGKFINGIHKDNLSVDLFGGNFQLENISLNQQFFDQLNTPFKLTYSSIGKLNLQAPLSKLSSTPVECTLDNIYAVFQFRTDGNTQEQTSPQKLLQQKKQFIQKYVRDMFDEYLKKLRDKDEKKQDGMMTKLGKKIIDNLQLKIINIHIRFEQNKDNQKYAWGVTLQEISFMTTDKQWKPSFIDRSAESGKNEKLLKKMNLKNLSLYWQSGSMQKNQPFITQIQNSKQRAAIMASMIKQNRYSIISLTSEVKFTINQPENFQAPLYQLEVDLQPIVFQLQKVQVSQMIDFTRKNISSNQKILKNLTLKKKKTKKQLLPQEKRKLQNQFEQYVQYLIDQYEAQKQKVKRDQFYDQNENLLILKTLSNKVEDQQLLLWSLKPIRRKVKETRQKQLKKKKKGWFSGQYQLTEDQSRALQNFVEQVTETDEKQRPPQCLFFSIKVIIQRGKFAFIDNKGLPEEQKLQFQIGRIDIFLVKSQNDSILDLAAGVESICLNLYVPIYGTDQSMKMNIVKNLQSQQEQFFDPGQQNQNKFIFVKFSKKFEIVAEQKPKIKTDIIGQVKQIVLTYKKVFMKKFKSFFTFKNFDQSIKNETIKKWQQIKQKNQQKQIQVQQQNEVIKMFNIQLKIISPLFVCPLNELGGWCLSLGKLSIASQRDAFKQVYPIKVQSAYFRYYPNLKYCLQPMNQIQLKQKQIFCLVNDIDFLVTYTTYLFEKKQNTYVNLPNFQVNFNDKQYKNLISLKDIFKSDIGDNNFVQILKKQRNDIQNQKTYAGPIQKKGGELEKWRSFYGILSKQYIHLYGSEKQLKCIQKISIKNQRLQFNEETKIISLFNQLEGVVELTGSQFQKNSLIWKEKIENQMKSFMTIYEIVQQMIQKQQVTQAPKKRRDTSSSGIFNRKQKTMSFKIQKIGFSYRDDNNKQLMMFKLFNLNFSSKQLNKISTKLVTIQTLEIVDFIYSYKNPNLQTLLSTKDISLQIQRNKNQEQKKWDVQLNFTEIYINWKPDVLVIFMKLVYSYISKQAKLRVDDGQQKTRNQLFQQVISDPKFSFSMKEYERNGHGRQVKEKRINFVQKNKRLRELIKLTFKMKKIQVLMIHRQTHLQMFKLIANDLKNELAIGQNQKFVSGSIKSLCLYEMTGYPRQNYTENDKVDPYLIIKSRFPINQQSLIQYKWSSYQSFVLPNAERVNSFLYIIINPIQAHYFQQITFRLIDYILIQIILLLNQPEMVVANQNLLQQLRKSSLHSQKQVKQKSHEIVKILFSEYEQVIRRIIDPYFMDMYFELRKPSVLMKPQKNSQFYHRADFKDIIFVNQDKKNSKRFVNCECPQVMQYIYEQSYQVMCNECNFYSVKQQELDKLAIKQQLLFDPVDISLTINKLIMQDQINLIYPQLNTYDRSFVTTNKMSKLVIKKLTRQEYLLINKLVNFNMVFDDNKDQCFIHNFKITKMLSPKPIYYELVIPQIQLTGKQGTLDASYNLFTMFMDGFKLIYNRNADLNSSFKIQLSKASLYGYQYNLNYKKNTKNALLMEQNIEMQQKPNMIELMDFKSKKKEHSCMDITIKMKTTGQKIIQMNIESIQAFVKIHLFQLIFQWCLLEDWVFPTVSIYANDITFHLTIHNMSAWLKEIVQFGSNSAPRAFKLLGVFCYKFHRKSNFSQQHIEQLMRSNKMTTSEVNNMPQISYMTILLNTQIFHCLASGDTTTKRQVVQKITFNMIQKKYLKVANQQLCKLKAMNQRKINLDKGLFKFSFTDIFLMMDILSQISKDREYIGKLRQLTNPVSIQQLKLESSQHIHETQLSSLQNLDVDVQTLSFYLINNCRQAFIPILRLHLNNATLNKCNTSKKDIFKANFETSAFYFNATIFKWEPMLQKVDLSISKLIYREEQQNIFSSIQATKPILLNISKQMVAAIKETLSQWNKKQPNTQPEQLKQLFQLNQMQVRQQRSKSVSNSPKKQRSLNETVQLVSQYVIKNQIGYPVQIYSHHDKKLMYIIPHLEQVDYEYELQKYDDDNEIQILIGIQIIHNKYKFKRITHISLGAELNFALRPQIQGKTKQQSIKMLPPHSFIKFITQTKDSKRYLILRTSKLIQDYLHNRLDLTYLPFDHKQTIVLTQQPHNGREVSLYKANTFQKQKQKQKYRYIGTDGVLKIMGKALVYNYTPIPLSVNGYLLLPDQFITISNNLSIYNMHYKDCKGVKVDYNDKAKIYYIYCEGYIIDYAGLYYQIDQSKEFSHDFQKNGLKFTVYLLADAQNKIKVRLQKKFKSSGNLKCSAFIKPAVGNQIFQLQNYSKALCQYQTYGYLSSYSGNQYKDFKKIMEVTPLYVLSNTTGYKIKVCQIQSCQSFTLQPGERLPFFWQNKQKPQQIKIAALKGQTMWGYSGPLTITHNTHSFVVRNSSEISDYRILSLQIQNTNTINFVHIIDCHPKKGNNIMLCNHIQGITLTFHQVGIFEKDYQMLNPHQYIFKVKAGEQLPFGYEIPLEKHQIIMEMIFDRNHQKYGGARASPTILQDIQNNLYQKKIDIITKQNKKKSLLLKLSFEGNVKKLQLMHFSKGSNQIKQGQFLFKIPSMLISLVGYQDKIRKQIITVLMNGVQLQTAKSNKVTQYIFTIRQLQVENCLKISPNFPVILQSIPAKNANFFIQFMLVKDKYNSKLIHYIGLSINRFVLTVTSEQIQSLQQNIFEITHTLNYQSTNLGIQQMRQYELFQKPNLEINSNLYFIQAEIHPLKLNVTFKHVNNWGGRLIKTLASIDNCNLSVDGKKISHFSSKNISQFFGHLRKHYQQGISKVIFPMVGNLAIFGSPLSLAQRIGSGFKDLIQLPSEGFNVSPLQGGKGLAKGAGSLVKNTFQGAFNSVQSVAGSVGNGLSSLAFDDDFARSRQKIQNDKSQHIGQGLANGAKSLANGFAKGLTGLVTSPVQGAQQSGIGGFFIGGLKGLTGLVVKPVSGIVDATTKTFEGIKNTPSYLQKKNEKTQKIKRKRNPRVFYGHCREFRSYDEDIAMCAKLMAEKDQQRFENLSWYGIYHLVSTSEKNKQKRNPLLLLTYEYMIIHNLADNNLMQKYKGQDIYDAIHESSSRVKVGIFDHKHKRLGHITLQLRHPVANKLTNQIKMICNSYRPVYGLDYHMIDNKQEIQEKIKQSK